LVSVYGDLLARKAYHNNIHALALKNLKYHYVSDTSNTFASLDSLKSLLEKQNSLSANYNLAFLYQYQNDSTATMDVLNQIPNQFALDENQLEEHNQLVSYINLIQQLDNAPLDSSTVEILNTMATGGSGITRVYARNILLALDAIDYNEPIILPGSAKSALADEYRQLIRLAKVHEVLRVQPNPAKDYFIAKWDMDKPYENLVVRLSSLDGKMIQEVPVSGKANQKVMDTGKLQAGIYIVSLHSQNQVIDSKKVSIVK